MNRLSFKKGIFVLKVSILIVATWLASANIIQAITAEELLGQIAALQAQIAALQAQLAELQPPAVTYEGIPAGFSFEKNLKYGMRNNDVKYLQIILKKEMGPPTYPENVPATGYFGYWTQKAVIAFQKKYASTILAPLRLTKGTGVVGKNTKAKLNQLLAPALCTSSLPSPPSLSSPADGAINQSIAPTLSWQAPSNWGRGCPDDKKYRIQIDNNSDFSSPFINVLLSSTETSYPVSSGLLSYGTTYYWRVRAENNEQYSNYNTQSFRTSALPPPFDFSLSVSPSSGTIVQGSSLSTTVTANLISSTSQSISFSASGLPSGATASFSPTNCNPTCSSTVTITTSATTPAGSYTINITGTGGDLTRTTTYSLIVTVAPSLSVSLSANPSSGIAPLNVELTAQVSGITTGPANYIFYCNRSDPGTDIVPGYNKRVNYVFSSSYTDVCNYLSPGNYTAKVIVERGGLAAENRVTINVASGQCSDGTLYGQCSTVKPKYCDNGTLINKCSLCGCPSGQQCQADGSCIILPTLSVSLSANPSSGNAPLNNVDLTATVSGTATGPINYTFYCNRSDSGTNITPDYNHKKDGTTLNPYTALDVCNYSAPGIYTAKVIAERGNLAAENRVTINVTSPGIYPISMPLLILKYFPTKDGITIDTTVTADIAPGTTIEQMRQRVNNLHTRLIDALERGSIYHGYKDSSATPSLNYYDVETKEYLTEMPKVEGSLLANYFKIMSDLSICNYVENQGVKEVWIWGYAGQIQGWESNMASVYGDISNSNRDPNDLPICQKTYTVYHYNYGRELGMALEDHGHQIEHILNWVDGRDTTPANQWPNLLYWGKFVGRDQYNKILPPVSACGWTHSPPNTEAGYDWYNKTDVLSDCEDWKPDRTGERKLVSCKTWTGNETCSDDGGGNSFKVWWMQNTPGKGNNLIYNDRPFRNWWDFIGDFDLAMQLGKSLTY